MLVFNLILLFLLIGLTGFFVAAEFAMVKIRKSRIDQLIEEGNKNAEYVKKVLTSLDDYLSACQLGITVTALGLGWLGEPTVERLLIPLFKYLNLSDSLENIISFVIAFSSVTFLHVVIGELAPKTLAIQKAEKITLMLSKPLILFHKIMYPFIWCLNGSARMIIVFFGLKSSSEHELAHSEEELRILLSESYKSGEINKNELRYVNNIFEFDERIAKEIMVPRTEMFVISSSDNMDELLNKIKSENYTRYPVTIDGDKDHILGVINIKEILTAKVLNQDKELNIDIFIKPVIRVIETIPIHDLFLKMQKERIHMSILMDEYGGTSGLVTIEDILEEIVGEIRDEFDGDEVSEIQKISEKEYILDGKVLISEVNDLLGIELNDDDVDTIGGWMLTNNYDLVVGTEIIYKNYVFKVNDMEGHQVLYIKVKNI